MKFREEDSVSVRLVNTHLDYKYNRVMFEKNMSFEILGSIIEKVMESCTKRELPFAFRFKICQKIYGRL